MNFEESREYLYSLGNEVETMKLGLENIRKLLSALGDPQKGYLKIQVAGTNGKGSVCAFLNSICLQAGIRTGLFTSPHLVSITERVKVDGADISQDEFARIATRVRDAAESLVAAGEIGRAPTYFEQVTGIALLAFAHTGVELAILETGLGGRYDAVTAANAEICAITRIDLDHQEYLGETIEEIAGEKAAIIGENSKAVVIGEQDPEAMKVLLSRCREFGMEPRLASEISITTGAHSLPLVFLPESLGLPGRHQVENAKVAILMAETLEGYFPISTENILVGLAHARHAGRLEWIGNYLLDGAHNVGGARALREYLAEYVAGPVTIVFGAMKDKDVAGMAASLFPKANKIILTQPANSRAMTAHELARAIPSETGEIRVVKTRASNEAIKVAMEITPADGIVLVTGSLYLVGEVRRILTELND
jgi:dihydrofolate synthase/folylpolyglutamate synthase